MLLRFATVFCHSIGNYKNIQDDADDHQQHHNDVVVDDDDQNNQPSYSQNFIHPTGFWYRTNKNDSHKHFIS